MRPEGSVKDREQIACMPSGAAEGDNWSPTVAELKAATAFEQWEVYYQPIVDMRTRACVGAEALLRWKHPLFGMITPKYFIREAESSGEIIAITRWLICRVMHDVQWLSHRGLEIYAGINLVAQHFRSAIIIDDLLSATFETGVMPQKVVLELTERNRIDDGTSAPVEIMNRLSGCGFSLAIDDFGAHDSSLTYLSKFPISQIKIDKSFIDGIEFDPRARSVLKGLVALARSLKQTLIAEGVQTQGQLAVLAKVGITRVQGFVYAPPMPLQEYEAYASKNDITTLRPVGHPAAQRAQHDRKCLRSLSNNRIPTCATPLSDRGQSLSKTRH